MKISDVMKNISADLSGKRVLITQKNSWLGPVLCEQFEDLGAEVIGDTRVLDKPGIAEAVVSEAGPLDILIAHLVVPEPGSLIRETIYDEWRYIYSHLVDPLPRLMRSVLPQMINRRAGKIVVLGGTTVLNGLSKSSVIDEARKAQSSYVRAAGMVTVNHNIQVNNISTDYNDPEYSPQSTEIRDQELPESQQKIINGMKAFQEDIVRFAVFLATSSADYLSGNTFPFRGRTAISL